MVVSSEVKIERYLTLAFALWASACVLPALQFRKYDPHRQYTAAEVADERHDLVMLGSELACVGWLGMICGQFGWFANVWMLVSAMLAWYGWRRMARLSALMALVIGLDTLTLFTTPLASDEGAVMYILLRHLRVGVAFWFGSIVTLWAAADSL